MTGRLILNLFLLNTLLQLLQSLFVLLDLILQGSQMLGCTSVFATLKAFEPLFRHIVKQLILQYAVRSTKHRLTILP